MMKLAQDSQVTRLPDDEVHPSLDQLNFTHSLASSRLLRSVLATMTMPLLTVLLLRWLLRRRFISSIHLCNDSPLSHLASPRLTLRPITHSLPSQALDACLTKNGENVKTCIKQSEDLLVAIATYFKRAGVNQM